MLDLMRDQHLQKQPVGQCCNSEIIVTIIVKKIRPSSELKSYCLIFKCSGCMHHKDVKKTKLHCILSCQTELKLERLELHAPTWSQQSAVGLVRLKLKCPCWEIEGIPGPFPAGHIVALAAAHSYLWVYLLHPILDHSITESEHSLNIHVLFFF